LTLIPWIGKAVVVKHLLWLSVHYIWRMFYIPFNTLLVYHILGQQPQKGNTTFEHAIFMHVCLLWNIKSKRCCSFKYSSIIQ